MAPKNNQLLTVEETEILLQFLKTRFEKNMNRHPNLDWNKIQVKLENNPEKLWSLNEMEETGGKPDVLEYDKQSDVYVFFDCSAETPKGRRSLCYDQDALESRKEHKPQSSALEMTKQMQIEILDEEQYRFLQQFGKFDTKTSSWLRTPASIREMGGAIFGDWRYGQVFIYHNGAESYYAARGFRGMLKV